MIDKANAERAVTLINNSTAALITTHTRPDGDACGSVAAMCEALHTLGKKTQPVFLSEIPEWYAFLLPEKPLVLGADAGLEGVKSSLLIEPDLVVILDTNSYNQLPQLTPYLQNSDAPVLVIDHHLTADGLGDVELIDSSAAAAGLILYDFFRYADWQITPEIARSLFVAISTDTGWFQFTNTDSRALGCCANLVERGANPALLHQGLYQNVSLARFKLMTAMLNTLELHLDGRYATQYIRQQDFAQTGATHKDTENLIDECQRIATVETASLFIELADGRIKCSLRSNGTVDVRAIAQKFGGGGHRQAAGARLDGPLENAKRRVFELMAEQFDRRQRK